MKTEPPVSPLRTCRACGMVFYPDPDRAPWSCFSCGGRKLAEPHPDDVAAVARAGHAGFPSTAPPADARRPAGPLFGAGEAEREGERREVRFSGPRASLHLSGLLEREPNEGDDDLPW